MGLSIKTVPVVEPISLAEAKMHLSEDETARHALIERNIAAGRGVAERFTGRQLITATYELTMDRFPSKIVLPRPPFEKINTIKYYDSDAVLQTVSSGDYDVITDRFLGCVIPAYGASWPSARGHTNDVIVDFDTGYGHAGSDVPEDIRSAILLTMAHLMENREAVVIGTITTSLPLGVKDLLWPYRVLLDPGMT
jgi:uncharacterized phiE125 gp8 family phage protein